MKVYVEVSKITSVGASLTKDFKLFVVGESEGSMVWQSHKILMPVSNIF